MANDDLNELEVLTQVPTEAEAAIIAAALVEQGIEAEATGGYTATFVTGVPGEAQVVVRRADLERAREILAEMEQERDELASEAEAEAESAGEAEPEP